MTRSSLCRFVGVRNSSHSSSLPVPVDRIGRLVFMGASDAGADQGLLAERRQHLTGFIPGSDVNLIVEITVGDCICHTGCCGQRPANHA